jgi:hypothetical protein
MFFRSINFGGCQLRIERQEAARQGGGSTDQILYPLRSPSANGDELGRLVVGEAKRGNATSQLARLTWSWSAAQANGGVKHILLGLESKLGQVVDDLCQLGDKYIHSFPIRVLAPRL